jgi:TatD DNase family protein
VIDLHCHLDLYPDPRLVVRESIARELYVLSVTTTPSAWHGTVALAADAKRIQTALGLHPQLAHQRKAELGLFDQLIGQTRYVGEVGLDGAPDFKRHWADQVEVFTHILEVCKFAGGRILSIHSRHAASAVLDLLEATPEAGVPILHWFTGNRRELQRADELGCWFSVGPAMLASKKGRALVLQMPIERVLTESDGPFARLAGRAAFPWDSEQAVQSLSDLWQLSSSETRSRLAANLRRLVAGHSPGSSA